MQTKQRGAALAVSLIILLVLTLMVLTGNQTVVLQEKMSASVRDSHISLAIAEAGLKDGEDYVQSLKDTSAFTGSGGLYGKDGGPADVFAEKNWEQGNVRDATTVIDGHKARYFIELIGKMPAPPEKTGVEVNNYNEGVPQGELTAFKVVSRSQGRSGQSERILISYFGKNLTSSGKGEQDEEK